MEGDYEGKYELQWYVEEDVDGKGLVVGGVQIEIGNKKIDITISDKDSDACQSALDEALREQANDV